MQVIDWGQIGYEQAVARQLELLGRVASREVDDTLVLCTHPPIVTAGRATSDSDIYGWNGPVFVSSRGGRATYHGPSQLVVYPIVNLDRRDRKKLKHRDVHSYLRAIEAAVISALSVYGVQAEARSGEELDDAGQKRQITGVWVGHQKVASLGVAVKRWVTYHGVAINLDSDAQAFEGINPCGFTRQTMTCLEDLCHSKVDRETFKTQLSHEISQQLV